MVRAANASVSWYPIPEARGMSVAVRGLGIAERMAAGEIDRPRGTDDILLMHFHDPVSIWVDGELRRFPAHAFVAWKPRSRHRFGNVDRAWTHSWLHVSGAAIQDAVTTSGLAWGIPYVLPDDRIVRRFLPLIREEAEEFRGDQSIAQSLIELWLRQVARSLAAVPRERAPSSVRVIVSFIDANFALRLSLPTLAARAGLSVTQFTVLFRRHVGSTPMRYLARRRLEFAAYRLLDFNRSVVSIARESGYDDAFHFSRRFKQWSGVSPQRYRERYLER